MQADQIRAALTQAAQHLQARRPAEVERAVQPVIDAAPHVADAHFLMAIACHQQDKMDQALHHGREAARLEPGNANILGTLGTILIAARKPEEAAIVFQQLTQAHPNNPQGFFALGGLLTRLGRHDEAVAAFEAVTRLSPDQPAAKLNLANALYEAQRYDDAAQAARNVAATLPGDKNVQYTLGKAELASGHADKALAAFDHLNDGGMFQLKSLAYREVALRELSRDEEANAIGRLDDYVWPIKLEAPEGFTSLADFNDAICAEMLSHPEIEVAPSHRATRHGRKVSQLLENPSPLMKTFGAMIEGAVEEMKAHLRADAADGPFPTTPPGPCDIDLWVNIMDAQGHQLPHFHPQGWLSGCYYARLPDRIETSGDAHEGWIEFGRPAYHLPHTKEPVTRIVKPEEGLIVLFPSYLFHHTIPFESDQHRISFAFDVVPRAWKAPQTDRGAEV
jgi:uncharacterized protein (TIGR02466 family)